MASPEQRRLPTTSQQSLGSIPFQLNIPQHNPPSHSHSNITQADPFQVVHHNGHQYHLTQGIADQLRNLPPFPAALRSRQQTDPIPTVSVICF